MEVFVALVLAAAATPNNTVPGMIVTWPVPDNTPEHLRLAASFVVTGDLPGGARLVATVVLLSDERITLDEVEQIAI